MESVTKADLTELKGLAAPPQGVKDTMAAVMCLLGYKKPEAEDWKINRKVMNGPMLEQMKAWKAKPMSARKLEYIKGKIGALSVDALKKKSAAAASFFQWAEAATASLPPAEETGDDL